MAHPVLDQYHLANLNIAMPLGNHGGFSGARLWRAEWLGGALCLRAWPADVSRHRLESIHHLIDKARQAGLIFVPAIYRTSSGETCVVHDNRCWDVTAWMPGVADFHPQPSALRLTNACAALAHLHRAWAEESPRSGPCPAVARRLERVRHWQTLIDSGWRPDFARQAAAAWHFWAQRAWRIVQVRMPELPGRLIPWLDVSLPIQPCLCDIWHDHVLYTGDTVTGLVDYGSVKIDHVAVDLARLLGSLVGDDPSLRAAGLEAYSQIRPLSDPVKQLVDVLDQSGTILGAANWLLWLYHEGRSFPDSEGVARRLAALVQRME
jgi:Ser/Thr protein kinase RdoA (MazF antagonist)